MFELAVIGVIGIQLLVGLFGVGFDAATTSQPPLCEAGDHRPVESGPCEKVTTVAAIPEPSEPRPVITPPSLSRDCRTVPFAELRECMLGPDR